MVINPSQIEINIIDFFKVGQKTIDFGKFTFQNFAGKKKLFYYSTNRPEKLIGHTTRLAPALTKISSELVV